MTPDERDALLARARKIQSVGASLLSNSSLLVKGIESVEVNDAALPALKKAAGLVCVDPGKLPAVAKVGIDAYVLKVPWSAVEPTRGVYDFSAIEAALAANGPARMTLRVQSGDSAPAWLKVATGTVSVYNAARGATVEVCHWWEETAMSAWQGMIAAAGARYDSDPRVVMVSADAPMVVYSEPYILGSDKPSGVRLSQAGCNQGTQTAAITRCVDDTAAAFPTTLVELAIHSDLQSATANGMSFSWEAGRALALALATKHGRHLVLSDYGLGSSDTAAAHTPTGTIDTETDVYAWMRLRATGDGPWAGPISFQLTVGKEPQVQETYRAAAQNAADLGAVMCETAGWGLLGDLAAGLDGALKGGA